ncbi:hypothetical protein AKO1_013220 [Acrasis kona]|uniref:Ankyrin repeat protein n=1 Tax=Acrasis kona TaxID=1008807 RepID=A0AAW2YYE1_9EUKA
MAYEYAGSINVQQALHYIKTRNLQENAATNDMLIQACFDYNPELITDYLLKYGVRRMFYILAAKSNRVDLLRIMDYHDRQKSVDPVMLKESDVYETALYFHHEFCFYDFSRLHPDLDRPIMLGQQTYGGYEKIHANAGCYFIFLSLFVKNVGEDNYRLKNFDWVKFFYQMLESATNTNHFDDFDQNDQLFDSLKHQYLQTVIKAFDRITVDPKNPTGNEIKIYESFFMSLIPIINSDEWWDEVYHLWFIKKLSYWNQNIYLVNWPSKYMKAFYKCNCFKAFSTWCLSVFYIDILIDSSYTSTWCLNKLMVDLQLTEGRNQTEYYDCREVLLECCYLNCLRRRRWWNLEQDDRSHWLAFLRKMHVVKQETADKTFILLVKMLRNCNKTQIDTICSGYTYNVDLTALSFKCFYDPQYLNLYKHLREYIKVDHYLTEYEDDLGDDIQLNDDIMSDLTKQCELAEHRYQMHKDLFAHLHSLFGVIRDYYKSPNQHQV